MSQSASRGGERMVHQDFIARIRYSNTLPPPPNPPKLLEIPNTGLASGQYTNPGFASRLAREQPLNIEADAELGMPLDLVGMPGVFDGDESSIQAPAQNPTIHPHDRLLLRPLATLGKPKANDAAVSFLRRTEYIATAKRAPSDGVSPFIKSTNKRPGQAGTAARRALKRPSPEIDEDAGTPAHVKRKIAQSFETAARDLADPNKHVRHPRGRNAVVKEVLPLLPDMDAFPDSGAYVTVKFYTPPLTGVADAKPNVYDTRMLSAVLKPAPKTEQEMERLRRLEEAYQRDPANVPKPPPSTELDFYLPDTTAAGANFRRKFDVADPEKDDAALYTSGEYFQFNRIRRYETAEEVELDHTSKYDVEVLLSLGDEDNGTGRPAALFYPVMQRSVIKSQRGKNILRTRGLIGGPDEEEEIIDQLDVTVDDAPADMQEMMDYFKSQPRVDPNAGLEEEDAAAADDGDREKQGSPAGRDGSPDSANGKAGRDSEEQDAEGDEEE
ncbi:hypothetical protein MCOR25_003906 [Pyricularia grisea]|nr:hypothetical protein MCOR25_003906 [Pyricularia grisea]